MRRAGYLLGNLAAISLQSAPLIATSENEAKSLELVIDIPASRQRGIGPKKAGLLCLPNGRFALEDFAPSPSYLQALIIGILQQKDGVSSEKQRLFIILRDMRVNLCARDYLFSRAQYEGTVTAVFEIKMTPEVIRSETISLKIEKGHPQSLAQIMENVAHRLVEILITNN